MEATATTLAPAVLAGAHQGTAISPAAWVETPDLEATAVTADPEAMEVTADQVDGWEAILALGGMEETVDQAVSFISALYLINPYSPPALFRLRRTVWR